MLGWLFRTLLIIGAVVGGADRGICQMLAFLHLQHLSDYQFSSI